MEDLGKLERKWEWVGPIKKKNDFSELLIHHHILLDLKK
jgi:hypothetical protein